MKTILAACLVAWMTEWASAQLFESFEYSGFPPGGWAKTNLQGGSGWYRLPVGVAPLPGWGNGTSSVPPTAGAGQYTAYCTWNTGGGASEGYHSDQWLISPRLTGLCATSTLSFWLRFAFTNYPDTLYVRVSTNTANPPDFTRVIHTNRFERGSWPNQFPPWSNVVVALGNLGIAAGTPLYIAFQEYEWDNTWNGAAVQLDAISSDLTAPPDPRLSATQLVFATTFGNNPQAQSIALANAGSSDNLWFSHSLSYGPGAAGWALMSPATGRVAGAASQVLAFSVNAADVAPGTYYAVVTLVAPGASNSPLHVRIDLSVAKGAQAISFQGIPTQATTNRVALSASAGSGLPVCFAVIDGPGILDHGSNLSFAGAGTVSIMAMQGGNANWNPAPAVTQTVTVIKSAQAGLVFSPASPQLYGTTQALDATGGSGVGAVSYAVLSGPAQIVEGRSLRMAAGTGTSVVVAAKAADALYEALSTTCQVVSAKASQSIVFPAIADQLTTQSAGLSAVADSGLEVVFAVGAGPAQLHGTNLTFAGTGSVSVIASQAGDANWNAASDATRTFSVAKAPALLTLQYLNQVYDGTPRAVAASSVPPSLKVLFSYAGAHTPPVNAGAYGVSATVDDGLYAGAATGTLVVSKAGQSIVFPQISDRVLTDRVLLSAAASSALPVAFAVQSGPGVLDVGNQLRFTGAGSVTLEASQAGDANWNPALPVIRKIWVHPDIPRFSGIRDADFDGDGRVDPAVYDSKTGHWTSRLSGRGYALQRSAALLGGTTWAPAAADFDGDGLADPGVYRQVTGNWIILRSGRGYGREDLTDFLGGPGWAVCSADYDGDRRADYAVFEETSGTWSVRLSSVRYAMRILGAFLGAPGDDAVPADYDGDGLADPAIYTRADGTWEVLFSGSGYRGLTLAGYLGGPGWEPVPGDYDGDGLADPAVRRSDGAVWRVRLSGCSYAPLDVPLGL